MVIFKARIYKLVRENKPTVLLLPLPKLGATLYYTIQWFGILNSGKTHIASDIVQLIRHV